MQTTRQIYVCLPNENVNAWRPVLADHLHENVYCISPQPYEAEDEKWQFEPGDVVVCKILEGEDGPFLAAVSKANE